MSSIYKKLQEARVRLQSTQLNKTGLNSHSKQRYFSLDDFLPAIQAISNDVGLCGIISFTTDIAELTIHDTDSDATITITSPMADAALKSATPVQNLGAIQTYLRRYLWMTAMEIVEHDILDAMTGKIDKDAEFNDYVDEWLDIMSEQAKLGSPALAAFFKDKMPANKHKAKFWLKHSVYLKKIASEVEADVA